MTVGPRFGPETDAITGLPTGTLANYGVTVSMAASPSGTVYWRSHDTDCTLATYAQYSAAAKPTFQPASATVDQTWAFCYYSVGNGLTESAKEVSVVFDVTAPTPILEDQLGGDVQAAGASYTEYPTLTPHFDTSLAAPNFYSDEGGTIHYTTDTSNPSTASSSISVLKGVGQGSFFFSHADRMVRMLVVDDVGNRSGVVSVPIPMDIVGTLPSAGTYNTAKDVQLDPSSAYFVAGFSAAYLLLCEFTDAGGYQCYDNTLANPVVSSEAHATNSEYAYTLGSTPPSTSEMISLAGTSGVTTVYDTKFLYDSWSPDGVTDNDHQAVFVIDLDKPKMIQYPDSITRTENFVSTRADVYDAGFHTVLESGITNYGLQRDPLNQCVADGVCIQPSEPTFSFSLPVSATRPTDNKAVKFEVTGLDAAGNADPKSVFIPIGRSILHGSASSASANLGQALASGNFNVLSTAAPGTPELAPDYAFSEPARGAGTVYLFYDAIRTQVAIPSSTFSTIDVSTNSSLGLTVTIGDGAPMSVTLDLLGVRDYVFPRDPTLLTPEELVTTFNRAVLDLANQGTDLQIYMAPTDSDGNSVVDNVTLFSGSGQIETCITVTADATGLQNDLGLIPTTPHCVYDAKISGQTSGDLFGHSLAVADFDGDGYDDLAVGAPNAGGSGKVYIFHSDQTASPVFPATAPDTNADVVITGETAGDDLGWAIAAGNLDYNRDPVADLARDLLMSAPGFTVGGDADAGKVYVAHAPFAAAVAASGIASAENPRTGNLTYRPNERFGHALLVAQLNGAGTDEMVIGAPGSHDLKVAAGGGANPGSVYFANMNTSNVIQLPLGETSGVLADSKFGWSVGLAGNMYGNRCATNNLCVAIGAPHDTNSASPLTDQGAVYIGNTFNLAFQTNLVMVYGAAAGEELGTAFASGDINGDVYDDLVIGQRTWTNSIPLPAFFGGIGIVKGAVTGPTTATFLKHYTGIEVDLSSGADVQSRFGSALLLTDSDPTDSINVDRLIIGAPAGTGAFGISTPIGRVHIFNRSAFEFP